MAISGGRECHDSFWACSVGNLSAIHKKWDSVDKLQPGDTGQHWLNMEFPVVVREYRQKREGGSQSKISNTPTKGVGVKQEKPAKNK